MFRIVVYIAALVCVSAVVARAQEIKLRSAVVASGGQCHAQESLTNHMISATVGQAVISGRREREGIDWYEGFWVPWPSVIVSVHDEELSRMELHAYPNPFSTTAHVSIRDDIKGMVELNLFTLSGERVKHMRVEINGTDIHDIELSAIDDAGIPLASGQYLCEVRGTILSSESIRSYTTVTILK